MKREHVTESYSAWSDGRVGEKKRREIERHLEECSECRTYYRNLSKLLERPDASLLPRLEADPFLPARIRAMAGDTSPARARAGARRGWLRISLSGALLVLAASIGVFFGSGISASSVEYTDNDMITDYYDAFSQSGFASDWESVIAVDEGGNS